MRIGGYVGHHIGGFSNFTTTIDGCLHIHSVDDVSLSQMHDVLISSGLHQHTVESALISTYHYLNINDTLHTHTVDNVTISLQLDGSDGRDMCIRDTDRSVFIYHEDRSIKIAY